MFILKTKDYIIYLFKKCRSIRSMVPKFCLSKSNDQLLILQPAQKQQLLFRYSPKEEAKNGHVFKCLNESIDLIRIKSTKFKKQPQCCGNIFVALAHFTHPQYAMHIGTKKAALRRLFSRQKFKIQIAFSRHQQYVPF